MKNLTEQLNRIKTLMLIKEQCGTDLNQCETDLESRGYKVFSPTETKISCDSNENIQCLQTSFSTLSSKMSVNSAGNTISNCFVLIKSTAKTNGLPTFHITAYSDGQILISYLLNEHNDNKKLVYRGKFECDGGSTEIKGGSTFKFIGVKSGNGVKYENEAFQDPNGADYEINSSESASMGIPTGALKYQDSFTFYLNKKGLYSGNVLNNGLTHSQLITLMTHT